TTDFSAFEDVYVRVYYSRTTAVRHIDDVSLVYGGGSTTTYTTNPGCDAPQLVVSETTLPDFTYMVGNGPSVSQEFEISGLNLDGSENVTVALGVDSTFEISTTIDGTYSNTFSLTGFEGDVTTVYVRLQANEVVGNYTDTITISG